MKQLLLGVVQKVLPIAIWVFKDSPGNLKMRGFLKGDRRQGFFVEIEYFRVGVREQDRGMRCDDELTLALSYELGNICEQSELPLR